MLLRDQRGMDETEVSRGKIMLESSASTEIPGFGIPMICRSSHTLLHRVSAICKLGRKSIIAPASFPRQVTPIKCMVASAWRSVIIGCSGVASCTSCRAVADTSSTTPLPFQTPLSRSPLLGPQPVAASSPESLRRSVSCARP